MSENRGKFPGPYLNTTDANDPIMKRVPEDSMDIGARRSGMPKSIGNSNLLQHVGDVATGRK